MTPLDVIVSKGSLELAQYLHSIGVKFTANTIEWSTRNGNLEVVRFLHSIGVKCTTYAMDLAVRNGHLNVVQFLHSIVPLQFYN